MTFTTFADTAKVAVDFAWNGEAISVILHFDKSSPTPADFIALAAQVAADWAADIMPELTDEITMGDVTAYDLSSEGAPKYVNSDEDGTAGTKIGDPVPNNTAILISHRTNDTGRSARGRSYIPGLVETDESDGLLTAAKQALMVTAWGDFITAVAAIGWDFVVAQRFSGGVQLAVGVVRAVTSEVVRLNLGTQRRRQVKAP